MARNRMIKVEFWDDEKLATISRDARLTFIALWNLSDDYGVVKGNLVWLKNRIYPYDEKLKLSEFQSWVSALIEIKTIYPFSGNGEKYYYIKNFLDHQKINRPSGKRNPEPPDDILDDSLNAHGILNENSLPKEKEKEKEKEKVPPKKQFLEFVFLTDDEHKKLIEKFGDSTQGWIKRLNDGIGSKGYKYKSHYHTILTWHRKDTEKQGGNNDKYDF